MFIYLPNGTPKPNPIKKTSSKTGSLGEKIQKARFLKGFKQNELGALIGVSGYQISRYESNDFLPSEEVFEKLKKVLEF